MKTRPARHLLRLHLPAGARLVQTRIPRREILTPDPDAPDARTRPTLKGMQNLPSAPSGKKLRRHAASARAIRAIPSGMRSSGIEEYASR